MDDPTDNTPDLAVTRWAGARQKPGQNALRTRRVLPAAPVPNALRMPRR